MSETGFILGLDIGSVAVSAVEMSLQGDVRNTHYSFHNGDIINTLHTILKNIKVESLRGTTCTSTTARILKNARRFDSRIAAIAAAKKNQRRVGSLLTVGGEKFSLITFDKKGNYKNLKTNTSCAAGTGSFLDQQARRLKLSGSAELSKLALKNTGTPPEIASRCSVFARTDIIHAQQTGYSMAEICAGICRGLANNIADILLDEENLPGPIIFSGGVSLNKAVIKYLAERMGGKIITDKFSHVYEAMGACLLFLKEIEKKGPGILFNRGSFKNPADLILDAGEKKKDFFFPPLSLKLSEYPDFTGEDRYNYNSKHTGAANPVEVDIYVPLKKGTTYSCCLGFDIGSTSTKAVLLDSTRRVLAGFYTRTAGRPVKAVQALLETIDNLGTPKKIDLKITAAGTTGSGRKFAGEIIGADIILDEITAHARAAYELNPETDTIIEIGGQDAKFTTMRSGLVTFSQMNTICAAGTGSFLEEQAEKLAVPLAEFSARAEGMRAPLVSDRCTVFMERDINRFLNQNFSVNELLTASLFAVRENYLLKVATEGNIGSHICFQGATAKNKALAAAFEQKLKKPVYVSKYCHLTGALGVALLLNEEKRHHSRFRGIEIHKEEIPVRTETCEICNNRCRIRIAKVKKEEVAFGFLCGRDYNTGKFVNKNRSGFDLLKERRKIWSVKTAADGNGFTIGIPAALHLFDDLPFWKCFFHELSIPVLTSEGTAGRVKLGKKLAGAEFCAPMNAFYGHARFLSGKVDCLFLPIYLEEWHGPEKANRKNHNRLRKFCYYTQFASSLVSLLEKKIKGTGIVIPLVGYSRSALLTKLELLKSLNQVLPFKLSMRQVSKAYDKAVSFHRQGKKRLVELFLSRESASLPGKGSEIRVVLLGRPYTVLSPAMNNGIPDIFAASGVKTYFQDMLPHQAEYKNEIDSLLHACHWKYAAGIIEAAEIAANTKGLYPVYITSFKCAPDSFIIEYFKRIMEAKGKPYLILQLDEHDSNVGYETRIEAGIRSFRNHAAAEREKKPAIKGKILPINPAIDNKLAGKTVLFPCWDAITGPLLVANLRRIGIDARLLEEDEAIIRQSMRMNTGQCIPVNAIVLEVIEYIKRHNLDPAQTVLWMIDSKLSCNIGMYPYYIKSLLEAQGDGLGRTGIYRGEITHIEISPLVTIHAYFAYLFGGLIRKLGCQIRPYETRPGETDRAIKKTIGIFAASLLGKRPYMEAVQNALALFNRIEYRKTPRLKVAIFGDIYMRDNDVMNQDLVRFIEQAGGEVVITPYNEFAKITSGAIFKKWLKQGKFIKLIKFKSLLAAIEILEKKYCSQFYTLIGKQSASANEEFSEIFSTFNMRLEQEGESWENILKIFHILKEHPDISLFVQTNPAFCCPSLVTEAQGRDIERITGVPIVTLTYDGTGTPINDRIIPYLMQPQE